MAITNAHMTSATQYGVLRLPLPFGCIEPQRTRPPGTDADAPSPNQTAFHTLRDLLARKTAIERRIAQTIDGLEKAMGTTFREFDVVIASRTQLLTSTNAPVDVNAATTALILKP
ncbi:hypothetical protein E4T52_10031 [Aureobasidium sp. EXF-3400]|nr:hypothetical protein E4T51_09067 [Aureobasidium sp. EXF-12344]KAI4775022.1 hypothetical protein E4T52_10031 [Aureobasidium sp. EXF-3400]